MSGQLYSLCVFSGIGIVMNLIVLTWQGLYLQIDRGYRFVKLGLLMTYTSQCLLGVAVICIILYRDLTGHSLCQAAGFLVLFGGQMTLWSMCITTASLHLWQKRLVSRELRRRNVTVFILVSAMCCIVVTIISILPITNLTYFKTDLEFAFTCTPLRLRGEPGWAFSTLTLILCWIALIFTILPLVFQLYKHSHCFHPKTSDSLKKYDAASQLRFINPCVQCQLYTSIALMAAGWTIVMSILSAGYSSGVRDNDNLQWVLGFIIACTLIVPPGCLFLGRLIRKFWLQEDQELSTLRSLLKSTPKKLESINKLTPRSQEQKTIIPRYEVQWKQPGGSLRSLTGVMKVYPPAAQLKWRAELNTMAKLSQKHHSNIAEYLWLTPDNNFTSMLNDVISKEASLVCMNLYRSGNLRHYMSSRTTPLSDAALHNITLDIANGLEFIHSHFILHNALNAETVYVANSSESTGIRVVIGDFEKSTLVLMSSTKLPDLTKLSPWKPNPSTTDLYTITQQLQARPSQTDDVFASDVKAYGLILLEMLVTTTHGYQQNQNYPAGLRLLETPSSIMTCTESQLDMASSTSGKSAQCACSTRVTDLRANNERCFGMNPFMKSSHSCRNSIHSVQSAFHYPTNTKRSMTNSSATSDIINSLSSNDINNNVHIHENPIRSKSRPTLVLQVPDSSESETDTLVDARSKLGKKINGNKQILTNGSFMSSNRSAAVVVPTKSDVGTSTDDLEPEKNLESIIDDLNLTPILEEGEVSKNAMTTTFKPPRLRMSAKGKINAARRKNMPLPQDDNKAGRVYNTLRHKRNSLASLDESVISGDSGVGSSHYDTGSAMSDQSSFYNYATNRENLQAKNFNLDEDDDNVSLSQFYNMRKHRSAFTSTKSIPKQEEEHNERSQNQENIYEQLPDFTPGLGNSRKQKQPCIGQHKHVHGRTCSFSHPESVKRITAKDSHINKYGGQHLSVHNADEDHCSDSHRTCRHNLTVCADCNMQRLYKKHVLGYTHDYSSNAGVTNEQSITDLTSTMSSDTQTLSEDCVTLNPPLAQRPSISSLSRRIPTHQSELRPVKPTPTVGKEAAIRSFSQVFCNDEQLNDLSKQMLPLSMWHKSTPPTVGEVLTKLQEFLPNASVV